MSATCGAVTNGDDEQGARPGRAPSIASASPRRTDGGVTTGAGGVEEKYRSPLSTALGQHFFANMHYFWGLR
jgi:hypothetical protein